MKSSPLEGLQSGEGPAPSRRSSTLSDSQCSDWQRSLREVGAVRWDREGGGARAALLSRQAVCCVKAPVTLNCVMTSFLLDSSYMYDFFGK